MIPGFREYIYIYSNNGQKIINKKNYERGKLCQNYNDYK